VLGSAALATMGERLEGEQITSSKEVVSTDLKNNITVTGDSIDLKP
jgi:hypothetical protein